MNPMASCRGWRRPGRTRTLPYRQQSYGGVTGALEERENVQSPALEKSGR